MNGIRLQAILIFFLGMVIITPNYAQKEYDWNKPLCIASDTGLGGPRYIETNLPLNEKAQLQTVEFTLRCKADIPILIQTQTGANSIFADKLIREYLPTHAIFDVTTIVAVLNTGEIQKSILKVFDTAANRPGNVIHLEPLGKNQFYELSVRVTVHEKIFRARVIPEKPQSISPLYIPLFSVVDRSSGLQKNKYAPYPLYLVSTFDKFPDPCVTPGPDIIVPTDIDFGNLNRENLLSGVTKRFPFRIVRSSQDTCGYNLYPIVTFKPMDPTANDEIYLQNGTILTLTGKHYSPNGNSDVDYGRLKMNTPMRLGELKPGEIVNIFIDATLRKNPNKALRGGHFSSVLVYHIEHR